MFKCNQKLNKEIKKLEEAVKETKECADNLKESIDVFNDITKNMDKEKQEIITDFQIKQLRIAADVKKARYNYIFMGVIIGLILILIAIIIFKGLSISKDETLKILLSNS